MKMIKRKSKWKMVVVASLMMGLISCSAKTSAPKGDAGTNPTETKLLEKKWVLVTLYGKPIPKTMTTEAFISFGKEGVCNGNGSCNYFTGTHTLKKNQLSFGNMASTERFCADMQTEDSFYKMLQEVDSYRLSGEQLSFYKGETLLATFVAKQK